MSTTKVQSDMVDIDGATTATIATGDKVNFLDITDSLVKEDTVQGILDLASGGWAVVETLTAAGGDPNTFTHTVAAGYDYLVTMRNIKFSADPGACGLQLGTGGGPTFATSGYEGNSSSHRSTTINAGTDTTAHLCIGNEATTIGGTGAGENHSGEFLLLNPGANEETYCYSWFTGDSNSAARTVWVGAGIRTTAEVVTGIRFEQASGNMTTGKLILSRKAIT